MSSKLDALTRFSAPLLLRPLKRLTKWLAGIQHSERVIQPIEQVVLRGDLITERGGNAQRHPRCGHKIARGLIDLDHGAWPQEELSWLIPGLPAAAAQPGPPVEREQALLPISPLLAQEYLLMVAVAGGVWLPINRGQRLGVREVARLTKGQEERYRRCIFPA